MMMMMMRMVMMMMMMMMMVMMMMVMLMICFGALAELFEHHWVCPCEAESFGQTFKCKFAINEPLLLCW